MAQLQASAQQHGGVIWALDGLQPDQEGTQLYVLYEILSQRPVAAAWLDQRDSAHLQAWLSPYQQLGLPVVATLSDGEGAAVEALKTLWPQAPHQMCQVHFLGAIAQLLAASFQPDQPARTTLPVPAQALRHPSTATSQQVKQRLQHTLTTWTHSPCLTPLAHAFLTHTQRLVTKWEADLFHCYDLPGLPSSNALLEACFNRLRRAQRRISGRKKTAELRRTAHLQVLLHVSSPQELWDLLTTVPLAAYHQARQQLEAAEERQRWLYRLHRWPVKTVTAMIDDYLILRRLVQQLSPADP